MGLILFSWMLLTFGQAIEVVSPAYPPNAATGGSVVAVMHVSAGSVKSVDILKADEPFADTVRTALERWRWEPSESGDILAVVDFRTPNLYPTGSPTRALKGVQAPDGLASPRTVVEPAYPADSLAEGGIIMEIDISGDGTVSKTKVVQGNGSVANACVSAVGQWRFNPARGAKGATSPSKAYAICVIRRPVVISKTP